MHAVSWIMGMLMSLISYLISCRLHFISLSEYKHVLGLSPLAAGPFQHATCVIGFHAFRFSNWGYALCRRPP